MNIPSDPTSKTVTNAPSFFMPLILQSKRNAKNNHIYAICKDDGSLTTSNQQVADEFVRYYKNLLGNSCIVEPIEILMGIFRSGPLVSVEEASRLIRDVSDAEIKAALFGICSARPGPAYN